MLTVTFIWGQIRVLCDRKWCKTKENFIPYPFLRVHWWIVESPPLIWHRMPYGTFIVCIFWIRWRCQLTCAICRYFSEQFLKILPKNIMSYSMKKKVFVCVSGMGVGGVTAPRRFVTMNCEPSLWKCLIRHLDNLIAHNLSDLKWHHVQKTGLTQDFRLFQAASKVTYCKPTAVPSMGGRPETYMGNMPIS